MLIILLILIFTRPFISSLAFPYLNSIYSMLFLGFLTSWIAFKKIDFLQIKSLARPLILFSLALIISVVFSPDKFNSFRELYKYAAGIIIFLIIIPLANLDKLRIIRVITLASLLISLMAIYQYFFGFKHLLNYVTKKEINNPFILDYIMNKRVFFPFITPNTLAGYLAMTIPLVLITNDKKKWLIGLPILFALFLTKSMGAILSLSLGLGLYFYLKSGFTKKKITLLGLMAVFIIFIFISRQIQTKEHLLPTFSLFRRLDYWQQTWEIIKLHPFTGIGLGNFNLNISRYAHNSYLQLAAETGILGLVSFLWLISKTLKPRNINPCLITASAIFLMHNFVDFTFFLPEVSLIWWAILGLGLRGNFRLGDKETCEISVTL